MTDLLQQVRSLASAQCMAPFHGSAVSLTCVLYRLQAIGAAGAAALLSAIAARGWANARPGGKVTVLTHCNTGSLATAGYGTALGVVRALHEMGKLQHCYACETRPYNQGARGRRSGGREGSR